MRAALRPLSMVGTLLALGAAWLIWDASARLADILKWPSLLPLVRLGAVVAGVTLLEYAFAVLRPLLSGRPASRASKGADQ